MLFLALAVYLFEVGRHALAIARFGWGRIIMGSIVLYSSAVDHCDLVPALGFKHLEPANETQALGMKFTAIIISLGCILLIFSGVWRGFRPHRTSPPAKRPHHCRTQAIRLIEVNECNRE